MEIENRKRDFQHVQTLRSLGHDMNDTPSEENQSKKSEVTTGDNSKVQSKGNTFSCLIQVDKIALNREIITSAHTRVM